ncbi:helix-turn-helix domain-containing protein [Streptomyces melanogenes]|uniref:helix-turn-helix domain-containing protein n=1 Tax=Streptomyces melanogenes TaxID=67326 RepID=UPI0037AE8D03
MSLLHAAPSEFTIERVRALVRQVGPEAPTVEYKEQMAESIARGVAALANTYGGLLLVGVTDKTRVVKGVKEKTIDSVADHCHAKIEPPWVPEIIPVPLGQGSDLYVLVLRVVPGQHRRPLLVDGVAYVRDHSTTHPANWHRLRELFEETAPAEEPAWSLQAPGLPQRPQGDPDPAVDFVMRTGVDFPVSAEALWRPLSERSINTFADALNNSRLTDLLASLGHPAGEGGLYPFRRAGFNRSRDVRLQWSAAPDDWPQGMDHPMQAVAQLKIPGSYGDHGQRLRVELDVVARISDMTDVLQRGSRPSEPVRERIGVQTVAGLMDAMVETLVSQSAVVPLAELAAIDPLAVPQPRNLHMIMGRLLSEVLDTTALKPIPDAGPSHGGASPCRPRARPGRRPRALAAGDALDGAGRARRRTARHGKTPQGDHPTPLTAAGPGHHGAAGPSTSRPRIQVLHTRSRPSASSTRRITTPGSDPYSPTHWVYRSWAVSGLLHSPSLTGPFALNCSRVMCRAMFRPSLPCSHSKIPTRHGAVEKVRAVRPPGQKSFCSRYLSRPRFWPARAVCAKGR